MPVYTRNNFQVVNVGGILIGHKKPVVIQSMTNTETTDVDETVSQIIELSESGSELVRITVNTDKAAKAVPIIKDQLDKKGYNTPLIGDFHFNGHNLLAKNPNCAESLDKYRINPGNVGKGEKHDSQFAKIIEIACKYDKPVRIGVNWGSLDQELLSLMMEENNKCQNPLDIHALTKKAVINSAIGSAQIAEEIGLKQNKIILSCKMSHVPDLIDVYRDLATLSEYPLHLGLTEAGIGIKGIVSSTAALSILLNEGIGDTIRVSLTPSPNGSRTDEVKIAQEVLQSLNLRHFSPSVTSCPGCGRTSNNLYLTIAEKVQNYVIKRSSHWNTLNKSANNISIAVMGCIVNGPGESKHANIGICLPGKGEDNFAPVYIEGKKTTTLRGENIAEQFIDILENYITNNDQVHKL